MILTLALLSISSNVMATEHETLVGVLRFNELSKDIYNRGGKVIEVRRFDDNLAIVRYELN